VTLHERDNCVLWLYGGGGYCAVVVVGFGCYTEMWFRISQTVSDDDDAHDDDEDDKRLFGIGSHHVKIWKTIIIKIIMKMMFNN